LAALIRIGAAYGPDLRGGGSACASSPAFATFFAAQGSVSPGALLIRSRRSCWLPARPSPLAMISSIVAWGEHHGATGSTSFLCSVPRSLCSGADSGADATGRSSCCSCRARPARGRCDGCHRPNGPYAQLMRSWRNKKPRGARRDGDDLVRLFRVRAMVTTDSLPLRRRISARRKQPACWRPLAALYLRVRSIACSVPMFCPAPW